MPLPTEEDVFDHMKRNEGREYHPEVLAAKFQMSQPSMITRLNSLIRQGRVTERYLSSHVRLFQVPEKNPRAPAPYREPPEWRPLNRDYLAAQRRQMQVVRERAL